MNLIRLNEAVPYWATKGFFQSLRTVEGLNIPWDSSDDALLDFYFFSQNSGLKLISPMLQAKIGENNTISENDFVFICQIIYSIFGKNWVKLYATLNFDYNPIDNYSMTEDSTDNETDNETRTPNITTTTTPNTTTTTTPTNYKTTTKEKTYGFDSSSAVPSDETEVETTGTTSTSQTGTTSTTETGTEQTGKINAKSHHLSRTGNIGVTTSQRMIEQERKLWDWFFFSRVFKDLDSLMTLGLYYD